MRDLILFASQVFIVTVLLVMAITVCCLLYIGVDFVVEEYRPVIYEFLATLLRG